MLFGEREEERQIKLVCRGRRKGRGKNKNPGGGAGGGGGEANADDFEHIDFAKFSQRPVDCPGLRDAARRRGKLKVDVR